MEGIYDLMDRVYAVCVDPKEKMEVRWAALSGLMALRWKVNAIESKKGWDKKWRTKRKSVEHATKANP